jgi:hypothetical protein
MMQQKHHGEAMTGAPGALLGEAIRPFTLFVARQSCEKAGNTGVCTLVKSHLGELVKRARSRVSPGGCGEMSVLRGRENRQ